MTTVILEPSIVYRITADPQLFDAVPFLAPMRAPAVSAHAKLGDGNCTGCTQNARSFVSHKLGNALAFLISEEAKKKPNQLNTLKQIVAKVLNTTVDEVRIKYRDQAGKDQEVVF